jgi:hypothetical protein
MSMAENKKYINVDDLKYENGCFPNSSDDADGLQTVTKAGPEQTGVFHSLYCPDNLADEDKI